MEKLEMMDGHKQDKKEKGLATTTAKITVTSEISIKIDDSKA